MKNNLLEINFLQNIIEKYNQHISELLCEIENDTDKKTSLKQVVLKQQLNSFIKKRKNAKKTFNILLQIK